MTDSNTWRHPIDEDALLDVMDVRSLRALVRQLQNERDRLLSERETHLRQVEQAFTRRHNQQQSRIASLEKQLTAARRASWNEHPGDYARVVSTHQWRGLTAAQRQRINAHEGGAFVSNVMTLLIVLSWWPLGWLAKGWPVVILLVGNAVIAAARGIANDAFGAAQPGSSIPPQEGE